MAILVDQSCTHARILFPRSPDRDEQQTFFANFGEIIEAGLNCPECVLTTHHDLRNFVEKCIKELLSSEKELYMVSTMQPVPSNIPSRTNFLTLKEIKQDTSIQPYGTSGYYTYQDSNPSTAPFPVTVTVLKKCEELVLNHPLQKTRIVKDGCFSAAEHACMLLLMNRIKKDDIGKVFYYAKDNDLIEITTIQGKEAGWHFHVAAAIKDENGGIHVFDRSLHETRSIPLADWYSDLSGQTDTIPLHLSSQINKTKKQANTDYLIYASFNEHIKLKQGKFYVSSYTPVNTADSTIAFLKRCHLRATLKQFPLTSFVAQPLILLLKPTIAFAQKTFYSEVELNHLFALSKLSYSLQESVLFMTYEDIVSIEPCFEENANLAKISSQLQEFMKLIDDDDENETSLKLVLHKVAEKKIQGIQKTLQTADSKTVHTTYVSKVTDSLAEWIGYINKKKFKTSMDVKLQGRVLKELSKLIAST